MVKRILFICLISLKISQTSAQCASSQMIGSAANAFGMLLNETTPVAADKNTNTVAFLHRNNFAVFGGNTGGLRYDLSTNGGATFTSNIGLLNPLGTYQARYPNMALYNPASNTLATSSFLGYFCAALGSSTTWGNLVTGVRQLNGSGNTENYNPTGAQTHYIPTSFVKGAPGVFWAVEREFINNSFTGNLFVYKGTWNNTSNDIVWALNTTINGLSNSNTFPSIGFDPSGQVGWIVVMDNVASQGYYSPRVFNTSNGGVTWSGPTNIDLNQYACLSSNVGGSNVAVHTENSIVVDVNGIPHIVCIAGKQSGFGIDANAWHHIIDITLEAGIWTVRDIGNIQTNFNLYFSASSNSNSSHNWTPQASRTSDGTKVFFSWSDNSSVSLGTALTSPNYFGRGYDVNSKNFTPIKDFTSCNNNLAGRILFQHTAREVLENNGTFKLIPVYTELTNNDVDQIVNFRFLDNCTFSTTEFAQAIAPLTLTISPSPTVILCNGAQIPVQVNGSYNQYQWSNNSTTSVITVSSPGNLTVTARQGCSVGTATLSVQSLTFSAGSSSTTVCEGTPVTLLATGNALSYTWNPVNVNTSSTVITPTVSSAYTLIAAGNNCTTSAVIPVNVNPLPSISIISNYTRTCAGSPVVIQAAGAALYSWSNGVTGPSVTVTPTASSVFSVTAANTFGCIKTFTYAHWVDATPILSITASSAIICAGESVTLSVQGGFSYLWSTGSTASFVTISPVASTSYSVTGTNTLLCSSTTTVEQKVDLCTFMSDYAPKTSNLKIYPNPADNFVSFQAPGGSILRIYESGGKLIKSTNISSDDPQKIPLDDVPSGLYIISCENEGIFIFGKLVISHDPE